MQHKPFDLDAAKRGEPIQVHYDYKWVEAHFVGLDTLGFVVAEGQFRGGQFSTWTTDGVRMAPRKRTVYVNLYDRFRVDCKYASQIAAHFQTLEDAQQNARDNAWHVYVVGLPVEIEVTD